MICNKMEEYENSLIQKKKSLCKFYSPRRANSILFTDVALDVPTVILKLAFTSNVCEFKTKIFPFALPV